MRYPSERVGREAALVSLRFDRRAEECLSTSEHSCGARMVLASLHEFEQCNLKQETHMSVISRDMPHDRTGEPKRALSAGRRFVTRPLAVSSAAVLLLAATGGSSFAQKRTPLQTIDFPPGYETVSVIAELEAGSCTGRHAHPGIESAYVLEGEAVAKFDGKADLILKAGHPLQFAPGEVHNVCNVSRGPFKAIAHYIVEKGKPLVSRAP
jgi:quercetin dioxygenase-like cupin family protein